MLFSQEVPEVQRPLITKIAATWCPPCGGWAWDMFEELVEENDSKATLLVAHHSGDLVNSVAEDFSENFNAPYQPYFYYFNEDQEVTSANVADKTTLVNEKIDAASLENPIANAGILLNVQGDNLTVNTKTKFFQEASGEYYLGVYFVECNIVNNQAGQGSTAIHEKILRGAISSGSFGELLENGTVELGTEYLHNFEVSMVGMDEEHLEVITIIWKKEGDTYLVVNTNGSSEFLETVNTKVVDKPSVSMEVFPTTVRSSSSIILNIEKATAGARIFVCDLHGKQIQSIFEGDLTIGETTFILENTTSFSSGLYYLVLESDNKVLTKAVIFE